MEYRPWRPGDEILAEAAEPHLSATSLSYRFLTGTNGRLPAFYRHHIAAGPRDTWDAHVAAVPGHLVGWAEFGRQPDRPEVADLAVLVVDPWQRRGIASALVRALLPRCWAAGVRVLQADVAPTNRAARGLLASLFSPDLTAAFAGGVVHYAVPLAAVLSDRGPAALAAAH